jgi:dTDP-glucose 4,6-dehydratase
MKVLVTGTTGELGKQVINWFSEYYSDYRLVELNDLSDKNVINNLFESQNFDSVIHLASSLGQNTQDLRNLLAAANTNWANNLDAHRFLLISSDLFTGELMLREYHDIHGMNLLVSSCEDTFASSDFPFVFSGIAQQNISSKNVVPLYTRGQEVPEWFWVDEPACAIDILFHQAEAGKTYSIGGMNAWKRSDLEYNPIVQPMEHRYSTVNVR